MPQIIIGDAISNAFMRTGDVLFRPFRFKKWFDIAVCAMLALVGQGGGFFNPSGSTRSGAGRPPFSFDAAKDYVVAHIDLIASVVLGVLVLAFIYYLLTRWLNSRGQFMFFNNVLMNDDRIAAPWREFKTLGNSLLKMRMVWDLIVFNIFLVIGAIGVTLAWADIKSSITDRELHFNGALIAGTVFSVIASLCAMLVLWIASSIIFDLAVPVMFIRQIRAWPAVKITWRELFRPHMGTCLLFFLLLIAVRIVQAIWAFFAVIVFSLVTCCIGYFFLLVPIIGVYPLALLCLPVLTFERALKLQFVSQFGNDYNVVWRSVENGGFPVTLTPPPPPPTPPPSDIPQIY